MIVKLLIGNKLSRKLDMNNGIAWWLPEEGHSIILEDARVEYISTNSMKIVGYSRTEHGHEKQNLYFHVHNQ